MLAKNNIMVTGLLLTFGGTMVAASAPATFAAPLVREAVVVEDGVEPVTASWIADIPLPKGANRATATDDQVKFDQALQVVARTNHGKISRSEVLAWTRDTANSVIADLSTRLKESGYTVADTVSFDSEAGHVTPLAAMRGDKSDSVLGMWITTKEGDALLVWGRFQPDATPTKPVVKVTKATTAPKNASVSRKTVAVAPKQRKSSGGGESAAQRQAKAMKAYRDYQYVKLMGPISGPMYRSSKW